MLNEFIIYAGQSESNDYIEELMFSGELSQGCGISIDNLENGISIDNNNDYFFKESIYCTKEELLSKIKKYNSLYDFIKIGYFSLTLDEIKECIEESNNSIQLLFFDNPPKDEFNGIKIKINKEKIKNMSGTKWEEWKNEINEELNDFIKESGTNFSPDVSFCIFDKKNKKNISVEFDEINGLFRLKKGNASVLLLSSLEMKKIVEICDFLI